MSPSPTPARNGKAPGLGSALKRATVAGCAAATLAGCTGPRIRPDANERCPAGALEAMERLNLTEGRQIYLYVDSSRPGSAGDPVFVHDGPITSRVFSSSALPDGTLVRGRLWTQGETIIGRYTELELPNGRRYPFCAVLCRGADGCPKYDESTPDAPAMGRAVFMTVVDVFP